jgi:hypothetical protein
VLDFQIKYFDDEVEVVIEGNDKIDFILRFFMCQRGEYETDAKDRWKGMDVKSMSKLQLGYFAHDISLKESNLEGFIEVNLEIPMIFAKIVCKEIMISNIAQADTEFFWSKNK